MIDIILGSSDNKVEEDGRKSFEEYVDELKIKKDKYSKESKDLIEEEIKSITDSYLIKLSETGLSSTRLNVVANINIPEFTEVRNTYIYGVYFTYKDYTCSISKAGKITIYGAC